MGAKRPTRHDGETQNGGRERGASRGPRGRTLGARERVPRAAGKDGPERPLRELLEALQAVREGDFSVRLSAAEPDGLVAEIALVFNEVVGRNDAFAREAARLASVIG